MLAPTTTRRRPDIIMTARARAELARIEANGAAYEERRAKAREDGEASAAVRRARICHFIATRIVRRWEAAGYTSARLVDGLPRPERPHPADWHGGRVFSTCGTCGRTMPPLRAGATCPGRSGLDLVLQAVESGIPFGLGPDGLPTAGVPCEPGDVVEKLSRATCTPVVRREERQAA